MARLGELLVREKLIDLQQLQKAQDTQTKEGGRLGSALVRLGMIEERKLLDFLSEQYSVPALNLDDFEVAPETLKLLPEDVVRKHQVMPVHKAGASLVVAMADPSNIFAIDDIKFLCGFNVEVVVAHESQIARAIDKYYGSKSDVAYQEVMKDIDDGEVEYETRNETVTVHDLEKSAEDAPVIKLVNLMLVDAIKKSASDIHIEPYEKEFRVRYRIDGALYEVMRPPIKLRNAITSRIKIMSALDIAERRLPQDGRIKLKLGKGREMDFRVSVLPTLFGEKVVMRLLDKSNLQLDMTKLGFESDALADFKDGIHQPFGMMLVTGPTGSGKTTTLYSALSELNKSTENISTAEDPVEFNLAGINQVQMHEDIGLNFSSALRSFLRQDPDIIMVGEIRDFETGEIAVKAALTGHMVLSTLHTNDAPSTISRMLNMGIEPFLITAALNGIVAQRLARRICNDCKEPAEISKDVLTNLQVPESAIDTAELFRGTGCDRCSGTGYKGRVAIYEVMRVGEALKEVVQHGGSSTEIKSEAIRLGMRTLRQSAVNKLLEGVTTPDEVARISAAD